jgi:uncharacterized Ntn-hydrolase superfamily protein
MSGNLGRGFRFARRIVGVLAVAVAVATGTGTALATWSIVAVDPETRQVGVAAASCIGHVEVIAGIAPGKGVVAAQALFNLKGRDRAVALLGRGAAPRDALAEIADERFDPNSFASGLKTRQYGIAALGFEDAPASFTGSWTVGWSGSVHSHGVSVQGNMLRGASVVENTLAAFQADAAGCQPTLADRLMRALEAGAASGGDKRCSKELTALSAYIEVAGPGDTPGARYLRIVAPYAGTTVPGIYTLLRQMILPEQGDPSENPVLRLRQRYDEWGVRNPEKAGACAQGTGVVVGGRARIR